MKRNHLEFRHLAWALALGGAAAPAAGQTCPQGVVSEVVVENGSIFEKSRLEAESRFRWAYRAANTLHVRTRASFIRKEMLFHVGDCYDPALVEESMRLMRDHSFIASADAEATRLANGRWRVTVRTQDEWTTHASIGVSSEQGWRIARLDVSEDNLFGVGVSVGGFMREQNGIRDVGVQLSVPRLLGTRTVSRVSVGTTRGGDLFEQSFTFPFVGEVGRFAGRELFSHRTTRFAYAAAPAPDPPSGSVTHVLLPLDEQRLEVTLAGRIGSPGNLTIFGAGFSNETLDFPDFPQGAEIAIDRDFDDAQPADLATTAVLYPQTLHSAGTHVNLLIGQRNVRFGRFRGLDALRGSQDVALGFEAALTIGRSIAAVSAGDDDQPSDLYTRFRLRAAAAPSSLLLRLDGGFEGRQIYSGGTSGKGWKDALGDLTGQIYWRPAGWPRHTLMARLEGAGGWHMTQPFQLTLGGDHGVRGYDQDDFPGGRRVVVNAEDRIYVGWPFPQVFDLGVTLFGDVGRGWVGEAPFGVDSGWRAAVGGGLRFGFPAGTRRVARVDLAWPMDHGFGSPILRIALGDPIGLSSGLQDRQMTRSQRLAVGADLFTERGR